MTSSTPLRARKSGFTLLETLVAVAIIAILMVIFLPAVERARMRSKQAACMSNLRQIGIGIHNFRSDHNGIYPTGEPVLEGGVREFFFTPLGALKNNWWDDVYRVFQSLSNHLDNPNVLVCQADKFRKRAESFAALKQENVSYYSVVSGPGRLDGPDAIWAGDAMYSFTNFNAVARMYSDEAPLGIYTWSRHGGTRGNLLFSDGRVESYGKEGPRQYAQAFVNQNPAFGSPPMPPASADPVMAGGGGGSSGGGSGSSSAGSGGASSSSPGGGGSGQAGGGSASSGGSSASGGSPGSGGGGRGGGGSGGSAGSALAILDWALGAQSPGGPSPRRTPSGSEFSISPQADSVASRFNGQFQTSSVSTNLRTLSEIAAAYTNRPATNAVRPSTDEPSVLAESPLPAVVPAPRRSWTWLVFLALSFIAAGVAFLYRRSRRQRSRSAHKT